MKPPRLTYRSLEKDPSYEHPVDQTVRLRVGRRDLQRIVAAKSHAIVQALGARKRLWFDYEAAADELRARREAAYYDVGVEQGIAACTVHGLGRPSKRVRAHAQHVVRELLQTGVARREAVRAALVAAWELLGGKIAVAAETTSRHPRSRTTAPRRARERRGTPRAALAAMGSALPAVR